MSTPTLSRRTRARAPRALAAMLECPRYEVFPVDGIEDEVLAHVPTHATLTVTASPRRGMPATLRLAERLVRHGYPVVPHLSARLIGDAAQLRDIIDQLAGLGITEAFVIAGDAERPAGPYPDAFGLLVAMAEAGHKLTSIGVSGYPEAHPKIPDDLAIQAMWDKRHFASYIVSQLCFDPAAIGRWVDRLRARGIHLPVHVGVPGPSSTAKLLRTSSRIGVGESVRFLANNGAGLIRLGRPGRYTPDRLLDRLAPIAAQPHARIAGLHYYTFNDVASAERWRRARLTSLASENNRTPVAS